MGESSNEPQIPAFLPNLRKQQPSELVTFKEAELMQRRPRQKRHSGIVEPAAVDLQASKVGVRRQQGPQQIDRDSDILR